MPIIGNTILIFFSFFGFLLSFYISHKKRRGEGMVCPLDFKCDTVIYSNYSKFLGIHIEKIGLFYYGLLAVCYVVILAYPNLYTSFISFLLFFANMTAFLFSIYLTFIQGVTLKEWCSWCLTSAFLCSVVFITSIFSSKFGFISMLSAHKDIILALHIFGVVLGVGATTIADILFFKFLKNFRISGEGANILHSVSQIIWFALAILIVMGVCFFIPQSAFLFSSPIFLLKIIVVLVILLNGAVLNLYIVPRLIKISFNEKDNCDSGELRVARKFAFALGAISTISWYIVLVLGIIEVLPFSITFLILTYFLILLIGVFISQIVNRSIGRES